MRVEGRADADHDGLLAARYGPLFRDFRVRTNS